MNRLQSAMNWLFTPHTRRPDLSLTNSVTSVPSRVYFVTLGQRSLGPFESDEAAIRTGFDRFRTAAFVVTRVDA